MTASTEHSAVEHRISDGLARARQRVHRAVLRGRAVVAMERGFRGLAVVALVYAALSVICLLLGYTAPLGWGTYVVLLVAALLVPSACTMYAALRALPSVVEAAERLDLATADHNRIATALCLAARGARDPFTEAAITDGMSCLQRLQDEHPRLDPVRWCRARTTQPLGVALVATLASVACSMVEIHPPALRTAELAAVTAVADRSPSDGAPDPERTPEATERLKPPAELSSPDGRQSSGASESGASTSQREEMAGGRAGDGTGAQARASNQAANTRGQSTQAPANAANPSPRDAKTAAPKKPRESRVSDQTQTEAQQDHSSVSQGASGGGAMSVAHNSWSQHAQTAQGDREEEDSDEEVEEDRESSKQRGGVQPSLKDRNESPSRELGISGEDGPPGTGRGGPTPPKKSRGTASLVLGIPIPDFVKGRVGPGTTKVTHERVEPPPMPGHATAVIKVPPRILPETPMRRFEIPAAFAAIARDYLVALHSATSHSDRDAAAESAPPTESSGAAVPDHEE